MQDFAARAVQERDLPALAALYVDVFNAAPWHDGWSQDAAHDRLRRIVTAPHSFGMLVEDADGPVGFALGYLDRWVTSEHFHLKEMCTAREHQRRGIGTLLLDRLSRELALRGVGAVFLETLPGSGAAAFYRKQHFAPLNLESLRRTVKVR